MVMPLSVDIIKDAATPEVDLQLARQGVRYISHISKGAFMLISGSTDTPLIQPSLDHIGHEDTYDLIPRSGDFRIFLTGRKLNMPTLGPSLGYAQYKPDHLGGLAVITTQNCNNEDVPAVTAHELGHLLGLSYAEGAADHCPDSTCLMYHTAQYSTAASTDTLGDLQFENKLYCPPCKRQVGARALRLMYKIKKDLA